MFERQCGLKLDPARYSAIYICNDWSALGRYLQDLRAGYTLCEDTVGGTLDPDQHLLDEQRAAPDFAARQKGRGYLYWGDSPCCRAVESEDAAKCRIFPPEKLAAFSKKGAAGKPDPRRESRGARGVFDPAAARRPPPRWQTPPCFCPRSFVADGPDDPGRAGRAVPGRGGQIRRWPAVYQDPPAGRDPTTGVLFPNAVVLERTMPSEVAELLPARQIQARRDGAELGAAGIHRSGGEHFHRAGGGQARWQRVDRRSTSGLPPPVPPPVCPANHWERPAETGKQYKPHRPFAGDDARIVPESNSRFCPRSPALQGCGEPGGYWQGRVPHPSVAWQRQLPLQGSLPGGRHLIKPPCKGRWMRRKAQTEGALPVGSGNILQNPAMPCPVFRRGRCLHRPGNLAAARTLRADEIIGPYEGAAAFRPRSRHPFALHCRAGGSRPPGGLRLPQKYTRKAKMPHPSVAWARHLPLQGRL